MSGKTSGSKVRESLTKNMIALNKLYEQEARNGETAILGPEVSTPPVQVASYPQVVEAPFNSDEVPVEQAREVLGEIQPQHTIPPAHITVDEEGPLKRYVSKSFYVDKEIADQFCTVYRRGVRQKAINTAIRLYLKAEHNVYKATDLVYTETSAQGMEASLKELAFLSQEKKAEPPKESKTVSFLIEQNLLLEFFDTFPKGQRSDAIEKVLALAIRLGLAV